MQRLRRGVIIVTVSFFLVLSWLMNLEFVPVDLDRHIAEMTAVNLGVGDKHHALSTLVLPPMLLEQLEFLVSTSWIGRKHFYKLLSIGFKDATHVLEWSWPGYFWDTFQRRRSPLDLEKFLRWEAQIRSFMLSKVISEGLYALPTTYLPSLPP
jgi:hypothetical protein